MIAFWRSTIFSYEATGESMLIRYDVHVGYTNDEIIPGVLYVR